MDDVRILTEGDSSLLVVFKQEISPEVNAKIAGLVGLIREARLPGIVDMIPAFASLLINYNPQVISFGALKARVEELAGLDAGSVSGARRVFHIPVLYGGAAGPDLPFIAEHAGLTEEEVVAIHSGPDYLIYMLGFLPGFCYLGGLDPRIHTPRLASPRLAIPAGSVGIGGSQTGIYPMDSPGGWQLMGKTPVKTYDPSRAVPILVNAGDYIHFDPIGPEEFDRIRAEVEAGTYEVAVTGEEG